MLEVIDLGYRVEYEGSFYRNERRLSRSTRLRVLTATGLIVFCFLVKLYWSEGAEILGRYLSSEHMPKEQVSALQLLTDLRNGIDFREALMTFGKDILENEN